MEHKEEIMQTRSIGFGSSDAKMIASVGKTGVLNETAKKRIAEMLGLREKKEVSTIQMAVGNEIEQAIFESIKSSYDMAVSNPYNESLSMSEKYGFKVFNHIDVEISTEKKLIWFEIKASIKSIEKCQDDYRYQLAWHYMLLMEKSIDTYTAPKLLLTHYDTSAGFETFEANKITQKEITYDEIKPYLKEITDGLNVISESLKTFTYEPANEAETDILPHDTQKILPQIANLLKIAKEATEKADELKENLKLAMEQYKVDALDNEFFKAIIIPEGVRSTFDSKSFQKDNEELYKNYLKNSKVKSSIRVTLK